MRKDPTEFRERFKKWQNGEKVYKEGLPRYETGTPPSADDDLSFKFDPGVIENFEVKGNDEQVGVTMEQLIAKPAQKLPQTDPISNRATVRSNREATAAVTNKYVAGQKNSISPEAYMRKYWDSAGFRTRFNKGFGQQNDDLFYSINADNVKMPRKLTTTSEGVSASYHVYGAYTKKLGMQAPATYNTNHAVLSNDYTGMRKGGINAHELSHHLYNPEQLEVVKNKIGAQKVPYDTYKNVNTPSLVNFVQSAYDRLNLDQAGLRDSLDHDKRDYEGAADVGALGFLLYQDGVFDRTNPNDNITKENFTKWYEDYKKANGGVGLRPVEMYGIDTTVYLLNNTAQNNTNSIHKRRNNFVAPDALAGNQENLAHAKWGIENFNLPKFEGGEENIASTGAYIGAIPFVLRQNDLDTSKNKKVDERIANKSGYGWDGNSRTIFLNSPAWVKKNINPAWGIIDVNAVKVPFGVQNMSGATKDDNAFFQRHLGYDRDLESMPVTGIRFAGDYNSDGSLRLPDAEYTGLSNRAKDFIRKGIVDGKIKPKKNGDWTVVDEKRSGHSKLSSHLGTYSIRENNGSGIYDIVDTYDFPWYNPILNRQEGKQIEVRDTIHGPNAKPNYYNFRFSKKNNRQ